MVTEVFIGVPSARMIFSMMKSWMFCMSCCNCSSLLRLLTSMANSSPPNRATKSCSEASDKRRAPMAFNISSPAAWPQLSLMFLKRSPSRNNRAKRSSAYCWSRPGETSRKGAAVRKPDQRVLQRFGCQRAIITYKRSLQRLHLHQQ